MLIAVQLWGKKVQWSDRIGRRVKLRDLHILLAVAQSGSMARAADGLAVSQPVISKTIADLEHALGVRLLDRTSQGVEPTAFGRAFVDCGIAVFDELRRGVQAMEFLSDPTFGEVRIGGAAPFIDEMIPAVANFRPLYADRIPCHRERYADIVRIAARAQTRSGDRADFDRVW
jgi:DNA-binding transcriptional LysR family regulator